MDNRNTDYFDYQEYEEMPEGLDFDHLKTCPHCKKTIPQDALQCLYCGEDVTVSSSRNVWVAVVVFFVIIAFLALVLL